MKDVRPRKMVGPAWDMAKTDAALFGRGFVVRTPEGDICIHPDNAFLFQCKSRPLELRTKRFNIVSAGDCWYQLDRDGNDVRITYCPPAGASR